MRVIKIGGILMTLLLTLVLIVLLQQIDPKLPEPHMAPLVFEDTLSQDLSIDSLQSLTHNKTLPSGYERAALVALSAFPNLVDIRIDMILTQSGAPMESNFEILTLFGPKQDRVYQLLLNDAANTGYDEILLRALPFDAQVGILAHELGHVEYYHSLSTLQIAKWGIYYLLDDQFRADHERHTDAIPVYHGLGSQIWQYAYFVRHDTSCRELYRKTGQFLDTYYLTDEELRQVMDKQAEELPMD